MKAIALCRVSTPGQLKDGNLDPQIERVNKAAEYLGVEIIRRWELATSSRKGKNLKRKDLLEMYEFCKRNKQVKYLIVDEVDRFMRSIDEYYWWKVQLKSIGVQLIHANKPHVNPDDQAAVFDELIDVYKAEQSNHERITKTPEKQMAKMRAGYYPFPPLPGYKKSTVPSLHEVDPDRFYLLQTAFRSIVNGESTPNEALKTMTQQGYRTAGGYTMDMERFKQLTSKPYYAGIIQVADWEVATENGLHTPMLSKDEWETLKFIMSGKKKKFAINKKNPAFPMNETLCWDCLQEAISTGKITGYRNHNGKRQTERFYYERYRCRGCNTYFTKYELHDKVNQRLESVVLDDKELLIEELKALWRDETKANQNKLTALKQRKHTIEQEQANLAIELSRTDNETVKQALVAAIEQKEQDKLATQAEIQSLSDPDKDLDDFIEYAINYTEELKQKYWELDWDRRKRCELLLFPDGIYTTRAKKVYTPTVSAIYRDKTKQKAPDRSLKVLKTVDGGPSGT